jgi:aspartate/glutamate racemase
MSKVKLLGTTFSFRLNFLKTELNTELDTEILELDSDINNIKVLVVEDIPNQLLMKTLLDDFDLNVISRKMAK